MPMRHPDGTPYWEPAPLKADSSASINYSMSTGETFTKGGTFLGEYPSLTSAAEAFIGQVINTTY